MHRIKKIVLNVYISFNQTLINQLMFCSIQYILCALDAINLHSDLGMEPLLYLAKTGNHIRENA